MELKLRDGMLMVLMLAEAKINPSVVRKEPFFSMVPLGGDENIGEAVAGRFGNSRYPVWKSANSSPKGRPV
jgi:hypothetical protein